MKHHYEITVPSFLCRPDDQLGFDGMASIFQEAAWQHAQRLGVDFTEEETPIYWVLHRLGMRFLRRPRWGEHIAVTTWPSRMVRLYAMREFLVESAGELLVEASSAWIVLDGKTGRPVRPEKHLSADWAVEEVHLSLPTGKLATLEAPLAGLEKSDWDRVRPSDTDRNAHVNNSRYTQWLSDWAPDVVTPDRPGVFTFTAETRQGQEYTVLTGVGPEAVGSDGAGSEGAGSDGSIAEVWVRNPGDPTDRAVCACRYHPVG